MVERHYDRRDYSGDHDPRRDTPPRRVSFEDRHRDRSRSPPRKVARQNYDRSLNNNSANNNINSQRRAHTLPAAKPRSHSPELFVQSPPPIQPDSSLSQNAADQDKQQTNRRTLDVKNLCAYLAETVYYSLQQDTAEKKYRKVHDQAERYRETNFSSAMEVMDQQTRFADQERSKAAKQHTTSIRRLQEVFVRYHKNLQSDLIKDFASSAAAGSSVTTSDIDKRLEQFRESLIASIEKTVARRAEQDKKLLSEEFDSRMSSMKMEVDKATVRADVLQKKLDERLLAQEQLESRILSLQGDFEAEKTHRVSLEQKLMEDMACHRQENDRRFKELEEYKAHSGNSIAIEVDKVAGLTKWLAPLEYSIRNAEDHQKRHTLQDEKSKYQTTKVDELLTRLLTNESRLSELDKELSMLKQDASKSPKAPPHTPTPNDSLHSGLQNALAEVERLREQMALFQNGSSEQQPAVVDDHRITALDKRITQTRNQFRTSYSGLTSKFGELINKERAVSEQLDARLQEVEKVVDSINSDALISLIESRLQDMDSKYTATLTAQDSKVLIVSDLLNKTRADAKAAFEDYTMQLGNLTSWQNNWNTSELYLQIVNHINASYPQGIFNELSKVARRLEVVEIQMERNHDKRQSSVIGQQSLASMTPVSSN